MRLENLISDINEAVYGKMSENRSIEEQEARTTSEMIGLAALKYGDLSNQAAKDYVFDIDRFTSFEGNTGPYILYTIVRIKSILNKYVENGGNLAELKIAAPESANQKNLMLALTRLSEVIEAAQADKAPHKICQFIYEVSNACNGFYHDTKILSEENADKQKSYVALISFAKSVLECCIDLLGIEAPDRM